MYNSIHLLLLSTSRRFSSSQLETVPANHCHFFSVLVTSVVSPVHFSPFKNFPLLATSYTKNHIIFAVCGLYHSSPEL